MGTRQLVLSMPALARPQPQPLPLPLPLPLRGYGAGRNPLKLKLKLRGRGRVVAFADGGRGRGMMEAALWGVEAVYIGWLFLLPYAPGDPVWAISPSSIRDLLALSLNFFFVLPLLSTFSFIQAPLLHPVAEGLFNFVIAWTLLFAPLLFTDRKRDRFKGSVDLLWAFQMFLTNAFLIPYMAIRLRQQHPNQSPPKLSAFASLIVKAAPLVALIGGSVCFLSLFWACFGRAEAQFGGIFERTQYLLTYLQSERFAYAFLWDILLYSIFQPWLIADNIQNVQRDRAGIVSSFKFIPVMGLLFYLLSLDVDENTL